MSCSNNCGSTRGLVELLIGNALKEALLNGTVQGGLVDCSGTKVSQGASVVTCSLLASKVMEAIKDGTISVVKSVTVNNGELVVTDGTGNEQRLTIPGVTNLKFDATTNTLTWAEDGAPTSVVLPYAKADKAGDNVLITLKDGSTVLVPSADNALTADSFDNTIAKDANQAGKFGVKLGTGSGLDTAKDGSLVVKVGDGLSVGVDGSISVIPEGIDNLTNFDTHTYKKGEHVFAGNSAPFVLGLPRNLNSEESDQPRAKVPSELTGSEYDFNGTYINTGNQLSIIFYGNDSTAWYITNDSGVDENGRVIDVNGWGRWQKLDNAADKSALSIKALQDQITALQSGLGTNNAKDQEQDKRLTALENLIKSFVVNTVVDASGNVTLGKFITTNK